MSDLVSARALMAEAQNPAANLDKIWEHRTDSYSVLFGTYMISKMLHQRKSE